MTDAPIPAPQTVDTVVRAFTDAELALADITSSIAQFQSASDQLAAAGLASESATSRACRSIDAGRYGCHNGTNPDCDRGNIGYENRPDASFTHEYCTGADPRKRYGERSGANRAV